ncbi:SdpI family protein [Neobacillus sp. YIM B06451]|uniref:SdpI family protein n=1 Tax=Neobacillus sp. YIM B06451 TaxID=3070994 RepID=UPI00293198DF|nr:SdpI family protein [Neobacillus sp. YIM B06451]
MKRYWLGIIILLATVLGTWIAYPYLPDRIPTHWNFEGVPDQFGPKSFGVFILPGTMVFLYLLMMFLPRIDPKKVNFQKFNYIGITNGILFFFFLFQAMVITSSLGLVNSKNTIPVLVGLLFIFIGNLSPKFKPNYFLGIRTPWTLANEDVWKKTHRFGGKVLVIAGILMLLVPIAPAAIQAYGVITILMASLVLIVVASYYYFIKL